MKRTPMTRKAPLSPAALVPGSVPPDPTLRHRHQQPGGRPRAERLAGSRAKGNALPKQVRAAVYERDQSRCLRCGDHVGSSDRSIHHRKPRQMGGTSDPRIHALSNLVLLCGTGTTGCHGWIESNRAVARATGWLISRFEAAPESSVPLRFTDRITWLHDDGTKTTAYTTEDRRSYP